MNQSKKSWQDLGLVFLVSLFAFGCGEKMPSKSAATSVAISAPVNLELTPGDSSMLLTWSPNADLALAGYNVYYGTASGRYGPPINVGNIEVNNQVSFRVNGLINGRIYFFALTAYTKDGQESAFSIERSGYPEVISGGLAPPTAPRNLVVTPGDGMVELTWDPNTDSNLFIYEVLFGTSAGVYGQPINAGNVISSDGRVHYVVNNLTNGQIYYFTCRAVDTAGNRSANAIERAAIPQVFSATDKIPPAAPQNLVATPGDGLVDLQWSANTEPDLFGYRVRFKVAGGAYGQPINVGNVTNYRVTSLTNGMQYIFAITAVDTSGNESALSIERSAIPSAGQSGDTTSPTAPVGLWVIGGNGVAEAGWQANTDTDLYGYLIYWGTSSGNYSNYLNVGNRTVWQFNGLTVGQTYYFSLRAYDASGNLSPFATEVSAAITATATLTFTEQPNEQVTWSTPNANLPTRLMGGPTSPSSIAQICWNSDLVGWFPNSSLCSNFDPAVTTTIMINLPVDQYHRLKGNFAAVVGGQAKYLDLTLWQTNPLGGIVSNGQGGLEINLTFLDYPPAAPQNVTAAPGNGQAIVSWQANSEQDLAGYHLHYGTSSGVYGFNLNVGNTTGHLLQGLTNGVTYYIVITAYDQTGNESGYSAEVTVTPSVTVGPDTTPPLMPQNLVVVPGNGLVNLYWSANLDPDLASYRVYWGTQSGRYPNVISGITTTSQPVTALTNGIRYYFAVSAVDTSGNESQLSIEQSAVPSGPVIDTIPPNPPVNLVAQAGDRAIRLTWSVNLEPDLGGYKVYYGTSSRNYGAPIDVGNQTSYVLSGLTNGVTYYIAITAYDNSPNRNESGYSSEATAMPQADLPPQAPMGVTAVAGNQVIDLAWQANTEPDLAGYRIYFGTSSGNYPYVLDVGNVVVYRLTSLSNGITYYITIAAYDLAGNKSTGSAEISAVPTAGPDTIPPTVPQNLVASPGNVLVNLYWSANIDPDLASYKVYWGPSPGNYTRVVSGVLTPNYQVSGLANGVTYYFAVSAVDTSGNESSKSIERSAAPNGTVPDTIPPNPPVNLVATAGNQTISLAWSPNLEPDLSHYNLYYGTSSRNYGPAINAGTVTNYQLTGLVNGRVYYLALTAVDTSGNESGYSVEVTAVPTISSGDTTPPNPPTGVTAAAGNSYVNLGWNANTEPDLWGYKLYYGTSPSVYTTVLNLGNRLSYQVTGLSNGVIYYFALTAYDTSSNESGYSNQVTAMPSAGLGGGPTAPSTPTGFTVTTAAGWVYLSWNPNPEPDIWGYLIKFDTTPGNYLNQKAVGSNVTSYRFFFGTGTVTYYFILEAFNTAQIYSQPAGPVSVTP